MLNQTVLVGRLIEEPTLRKIENGNSVTNITLAVPRNYKNQNGEYETDFLNCVLWQGIAERTCEYCKKGDLMAIKGRIESKMIETKKGDKVSTMELVAEKVTFLSSKISKEKDTEVDDSIPYEENIKI